MKLRYRTEVKDIIVNCLILSTTFICQIRCVTVISFEFLEYKDLFEQKKRNRIEMVLSEHELFFRVILFDMPVQRSIIKQINFVHKAHLFMTILLDQKMCFIKSDGFSHMDVNLRSALWSRFGVFLLWSTTHAAGLSRI